jgi:ParB family chromosome partitioning protein
MSDQGQLQPIVVRPHNGGGYCLVAGLHRFEAAKKLKWKEINRTVLDNMEANQAELIEIDENLIRADLSPAERAMHIGKRKKLYEKVHPETKATNAGGPGRAKTRRQNGDEIPERFTKEGADFFLAHNAPFDRNVLTAELACMPRRYPDPDRGDF